MENQKNNKGVIALLVIIIIILSALCVLFATGTISFNTNKVNNNDTNENVDNNESNDNNENNSGNNDINQTIEIIYYQWYPEEDESLGGIHSNDILELHSNGTAKLYGGKRNSSGWSYEGSYTESDTQIVFLGKAAVGSEELLGSEEFIKIFKKQGNNLYDDRNFEYSKVTKDEIKG